MKSSTHNEKSTRKRSENKLPTSSKVANEYPNDVKGSPGLAALWVQSQSRDTHQSLLDNKTEEEDEKKEDLSQSTSMTRNVGSSASHESSDEYSFGHVPNPGSKYQWQGTMESTGYNSDDETYEEEETEKKNDDRFRTPLKRDRGARTLTPFKNFRMQALIARTSEVSDPQSPFIFGDIHKSDDRGLSTTSGDINKSDDSELPISLASLKTYFPPLKRIGRINPTKEREKLAYQLALWEETRRINTQELNADGICLGPDSTSYSDSIKDDSKLPRFILDVQLNALKESIQEYAKTHVDEDRINTMLALANDQKHMFRDVEDLLSAKHVDGEMDLYQLLPGDDLPNILITAASKIISDPLKTDVDRFCACSMVVRLLANDEITNGFKDYMAGLTQKLSFLRNVLYICNANKPYRRKAIAILIAYVDDQLLYEDIPGFVLWYLLEKTDLHDNERQQLSDFLNGYQFTIDIKEEGDVTLEDYQSFLSRQLHKNLDVNAAHAALLYDVLNPFFNNVAATQSLEDEKRQHPSLMTLVYSEPLYTEATQAKEALSEDAEEYKEAERGDLNQDPQEVRGDDASQFVCSPFDEALIERCFELYLDESISARDICTLLLSAISEGRESILNSLFVFFYTECDEGEKEEFQSNYFRFAIVDQEDTDYQKLIVRLEKLKAIFVVFSTTLQSFNQDSLMSSDRMASLIRAHANFSYTTLGALNDSSAARVFNAYAYGTYPLDKSTINNLYNNIDDNAFDTFWSNHIETLSNVGPGAQEVLKEDLRKFWRAHREFCLDREVYRADVRLLNESLIKIVSKLDGLFSNVFGDYISNCNATMITNPILPETPILIQSECYKALSSPTDKREAVLDFIAKLMPKMLDDTKEYFPKPPRYKDDDVSTARYQAQIKDRFSYFSNTMINLYESLQKIDEENDEFYHEAILLWEAFSNKSYLCSIYRRLADFYISHKAFHMAFPFLKLIVFKQLWFEDMTENDAFYAYHHLGLTSFHAGIHGVANEPSTFPLEYLGKALSLVSNEEEERAVFESVVSFHSVFKAASENASLPESKEDAAPLFFCLEDFKQLKHSNIIAWKYLNQEFSKLENYSDIIPACEAFAENRAEFKHYVSLGSYANRSCAEGVIALSLWALRMAEPICDDDVKAHFIKAIELLYYRTIKDKGVEWINDVICSLENSSYDPSLWRLIALHLLSSMYIKPEKESEDVNEKLERDTLKDALLRLLDTDEYAIENAQKAFRYFYFPEEVLGDEMQGDVENAKTLLTLLEPFAESSEPSLFWKNTYASLIADGASYQWFWTTSFYNIVEKLKEVFVKHASKDDQSAFFNFLKTIAYCDDRIASLDKSSPESKLKTLRDKINLESFSEMRSHRHYRVLEMLNDNLESICWPKAGGASISEGDLDRVFSNLILAYKGELDKRRAPHFSHHSEERLVCGSSLFSPCIGVSNSRAPSLQSSPAVFIKNVFGVDVCHVDTFTDFCFMVGIEGAVAFLLDHDVPENAQTIMDYFVKKDTRAGTLSVFSVSQHAYLSLLYLLRYPVRPNVESLGYNNRSQDRHFARHFHENHFDAFNYEDHKHLPKALLALLKSVQEEESDDFEKERVQYVVDRFIVRLDSRFKNQKLKVLFSAVELGLIARLFECSDDQNDLCNRIQALFEEGVYHRLSRLKRKFHQDGFDPFNTDDVAVLIVALNHMSLLKSQYCMDLVCELCDLFLKSYRRDIQLYPAQLVIESAYLEENLDSDPLSFDALYKNAKIYRYCASCLDYVKEFANFQNIWKVLNHHSSEVSESKETDPSMTVDQEDLVRLDTLLSNCRRRLNDVFVYDESNNPLLSFFQEPMRQLIIQNAFAAFSSERSQVVACIASFIETYPTLERQSASVEHVYLRPLRAHLEALLNTGMVNYVFFDENSNVTEDFPAPRTIANDCIKAIRSRDKERTIQSNPSCVDCDEDEEFEAQFNCI